MISAVTESGPRRVQIVGTGLIGGSLGLGLRRLGWHVTGDDLDPAERGTSPRAWLPRRDGHRPRRRAHLPRRPGRQRRRGRSGRAGPRWRRDRRRQREVTRRRRTRRPALRRRSPDGRFRGARCRRCPSRPVHRGGLGAHPDTRHRLLGTRHGPLGRPSVGRRGAHAGTRRPRRAGRHRVARPAPDRGEPHGTGLGTLDRAPGAAAPGRRRVPRHDPHRCGRPRASGSTSARTTGAPSSTCSTT